MKKLNITQLRFDTCPKSGGLFLYRVNNINLSCTDYFRQNKDKLLKSLYFNDYQNKDEFKSALLLYNIKEEEFFLNLEQFYSFILDLAYLPFLSSIISYEQDELIFELKADSPLFILNILFNKLDSDFYFLFVRVLKLKLLLALASKLR